MTAATAGLVPVTTDLDIYRSAKLLIDQHGEDASTQSGNRLRRLPSTQSNLARHDPIGRLGWTDWCDRFWPYPRKKRTESQSDPPPGFQGGECGKMHGISPFR